MTEPILTREEISALWTELSGRPFVEGSLADSFAKRLEAAVLEKVCGEPIYQIAFSDEDGWCDTHKKCYDEHPEHMRRIVYALHRSKP
ncbi:hypothetical protein LGM57_10620 [Burkholderia cepacia]|uniref:hypothetical protein n=1 Tax=Burkholderia cepacia TaxID=292 RepID=UPI001CF272BF|nr:hypothetical protein [Burkholderia cepacia]MCA7976773.1 hypothetical protein [Burkholderia cepacia]